MIRNPQILGSRAPLRRSTLLVTLCVAAPLTLSLGACGLKGPLYLPGPAATVAAPAATPSTPNTPAQ